MSVSDNELNEVVSYVEDIRDNLKERAEQYGIYGETEYLCKKEIRDLNKIIKKLKELKNGKRA